MEESKPMQTSAPIVPFQNKFEKEVRSYLKSIHCGPLEGARIMASLNADEMNCLKRLATEDDILPPEMTFDSLWSDFKADNHKWEHNNSTCVLFWERYPHFKHLKVVKVQSIGDCGTCHAQAPVVMQHYVVTICKNVSDFNAGMHSIPSLMRQLINDSDKLKLFLTDKYEGGVAVKNLMHICNLTQSDITCYTLDKVRDKEYTCNWTMERLKTQPGLVANFSVSRDFLNSDKVSFGTDEDIALLKSSTTQGHAMVLVGMRRDEDGQYWFLCQNWWPDRPFMEISYEYMVEAVAQVAFIDKPMMEIPHVAGLSVTKNLNLVTAVDRGGNAQGPLVK
jgi:hypothetical protein